MGGPAGRARRRRDGRGRGRRSPARPGRDEPLAPVIDLDAAVAPEADRARLGREVASLEASAESQHAAVGGGVEQFTPDEPMSDNVAKRTGYRRGDVEATLQASDAVVEATFVDQLGPPGLHRAAGGRRRARPGRRTSRHGEHAGLVPHSVRAREALRPPDRSRPRHRRDVGRRVRWQAADRRSARGRRHPAAAPAGPGRADSKRGLPDDQPGPRRHPRGHGRARRATVACAGSAPGSASRPAASRRAASRASPPS